MLISTRWKKRNNQDYCDLLSVPLEFGTRISGVKPAAELLASPGESWVKLVVAPELLGKESEEIGAKLAAQDLGWAIFMARPKARP